MGITHIVTVAAISFSSLLPASCHKSATPATQTKASSAAVATTNNVVSHDFGELALTNHYETCVQLGGGKDCIFTPKMIGHDVQITLALESKNRAGKIKDLSVTQVIAKSGKPFEVALGDFQFTFTPKIISE